MGTGRNARDELAEQLGSGQGAGPAYAERWPWRGNESAVYGTRWEEPRWS